MPWLCCVSEAILQRIPQPPWNAACGTDEVKSIALQLHASNHGTEETHTSSGTQVGMASEKPSHHVRCWTNDGHTCVCLLTDGCASSVRKKAEPGTSSPPPLTPHAPLPLCLHQSFRAHPVLPLLCRRFDIGNTVSALHGNNSGKDDINYLAIVWHMQGIVLAIIISTLSPEGMSGATAALNLPSLPCGLCAFSSSFAISYSELSFKVGNHF